jgi:hypothetical protein
MLKNVALSTHAQARPGQRVRHELVRADPAVMAGRVAGTRLFGVDHALVAPMRIAGSR